MNTSLRSPPVVPAREAALLRLAAQRIAAPSGTAADVVAWLTAVQAQDHPGALTSVALRTADGSRGGVEAALDAGQVVRSWPMRGTLHLVSAQDLGWMLGLTTERLVAGAARRRAGLGIDGAMLERARELASGALSGGARLSRAELVAVWDDAGLLGVAQRSYHLLWHLSQTGLLCFGPVSGKEQLVVLLDEWVPQPRRLERDEALAEWALRYFTSHGPATPKDFAWWTGLVSADVRAALAIARARLQQVEVDGVEHWMGTGTADALAACRDAAEGVFLLPGFDENLLGYSAVGRRAALPAEFAGRIVPGGNGIFQPTVVAAGQVVGTWRRPPRPPGAPVVAAPFTTFAPEVEAAVARRAAALP